MKGLFVPGLTLALAAGALANAPVPAPATQGNEAVELTFKFVTGAVSRFRVTQNETFNVRVRGGAPGMTPPVPSAADLTMDLRQKVVGVHPDGSRLQVDVENPTLTITEEGIPVVFRGQNGRVTATANGRPVPLRASAVADSLVALMKSGISLKATDFGEVKEIKYPLSTSIPGLPADDFTRAFGGFGYSGLTLASLPEEPKKPGDSWTEESDAPGPKGTVNVKLKITLRSVQVIQGRKIAMIETRGSLKLAPARAENPGLFLLVRGPELETTLEKLEAFVDGFDQFDVDKGELVNGRNEADLDAAMTLTGVPGVPAAQRVQITLGGKMTVDVGPIPLPPAPKPPAKKPAAKKPVRR